LTDHCAWVSLLFLKNSFQIKKGFFLISQCCGNIGTAILIAWVLSLMKDSPETHYKQRETFSSNVRNIPFCTSMVELME